MIVKDEEIFLEDCLKSAVGIFEEMVVLDTGSKDASVEIAKSNGATVFTFEWCGDFSAARNSAASKATNDWIFMLDADERIKEFDKEGLKEFLQNPLNIGSVQRLEMSDLSHTWATRLYNRKHYKYAGKIHEQVVPLKDSEQKYKIHEVPVFLEHYGYLPELMASRNKLERNEKLLLEELKNHPGDPYILYQLGKSNFAAPDKLEAACEYFGKALDKSPDPRLEYVYTLVECYGYALVNTGRYKEALTLINEYARYYEVLPHFRFLAAHVYQNNEMLIEAVECYESCIGAATTDYRGVTSFLSFYNIGVILECIGMKSDAIDMYKKCGDYEPALERLRQCRDK